MYVSLNVFAKIEYVIERTYLSNNRIRTLRILKPWTIHCTGMLGIDGTLQRNVRQNVTYNKHISEM